MGALLDQIAKINNGFNPAMLADPSLSTEYPLGKPYTTRSLKADHYGERAVAIFIKQALVGTSNWHEGVMFTSAPDMWERELRAWENYFRLQCSLFCIDLRQEGMFETEEGAPFFYAEWFDNERRVSVAFVHHGMEW